MCRQRPFPFDFIGRSIFQRLMQLSCIVKHFNVFGLSSRIYGQKVAKGVKYIAKSGLWAAKGA
jgi:hypothetical protein